MFFPESARPSNYPSVGISTDFSRGPLTVFILHCEKHLQSILQISVCCSCSQHSGKFWAHTSSFIRMAPGRWRQTMEGSWAPEALWLKTLKQNSWFTHEGSWFSFAHLAENCRNAWADSQTDICPSLRSGKGSQEGQYAAGEAACVYWAGITGPTLMTTEHLMKFFNLLSGTYPYQAYRLPACKNPSGQVRGTSGSS